MTLKGSFVSGKAAVSTLHPHPPLTPAVPGIPPPPAVRASFLPRRASGLEVGSEGRHRLGRDVILSSQRMSFIPDVISRGMMPPCQLPLNLGISSLSMTQSNGTETAEHDCVYAWAYPPGHICGPCPGIHSLIHSSFRQVLVGHLFRSSLCARPLGQSQSKTAEVLPAWSAQSSRSIGIILKTIHSYLL